MILTSLDPTMDLNFIIKKGGLYIGHNRDFHIHDLIFYMMDVVLDLTQFCVMDSDSISIKEPKICFLIPVWETKLVGGCLDGWALNRFIANWQYDSSFKFVGYQTAIWCKLCKQNISFKGTLVGWEDSTMKIKLFWFSM